jgi:hypothetical protein
MNPEQRRAAVRTLRDIRADLATVRRGLEVARDRLAEQEARRQRRRRLINRLSLGLLGRS